MSNDTNKQSRPGIWWPNLSTIDAAAQAARYSAAAGAFLAATYLIEALLIAFDIDVSFIENAGDDFIILGNLIAMAVTLLVAAIAFFRSRIASVLLLALTAIELLYTIATASSLDGAGFGYAFVMLSIAAMALTGTRAAFAYHRLKKTSD